jgi:hypothetical protein
VKNQTNLMLQGFTAAVPVEPGRLVLPLAFFRHADSAGSKTTLLRASGRVCAAEADGVRAGYGIT